MPGEGQANSIRPVHANPVVSGETLMAEATDRLRHATAVASQEDQDRRPRVKTVRLTKFKETHGTCVYKEQPPEGEPEIIGNLYLKKWFAGNAQSITVTVQKG